MGLEKIAEYKKKLGLTTEELSEKSGVPLGTLNKILSGATKDPNLKRLSLSLMFLGCRLMTLMIEKRRWFQNPLMRMWNALWQEMVSRCLLNRKCV